ncbi:hypothetical protein RIF29_30495 [Crotalaria pallida]|uniref:MADS-box domain-containing protein n=1 Tax=Crotalaria pallida TaxID=3830 RepID=A0AAN9EGI2_CROPI
MVSKPTTTQRQRKKNSEMKKLDQNKERHVTFSKRKLGLFNKVTELSILCQAETALILSSQEGKLYACGYPSPDAVIRRFMANAASPAAQRRGKNKEQQETVETLRLEYEATINKLKEEKENLRKIQEREKGGLDLDFAPWWNLDIKKMGLEDLEHFMDSLETLKLNLVATTEAKKFNSMPDNMMMPPQIIDQRPTMFSNSSLILNNSTNSNGFFNNGGHHQAWNLMNGCGSSSSSWNPTMVPKTELGHYYN